ncbi:cytochrome c-type biogenesis protein [Candidatus Hecatella orcuttiae]|jgi:cytochrome c-type biogenesis protein CcmH|uniref:cytochrome c-type biogenesis protein n=1 Tax=Candidatus Hecatella orcuttiae TaxID=1935119 RepID=UPI002868210D|nr:cytochrome c-type biogenesis protein CcmH [Candidatus Hecatella orcuttiae]
MKMKNARKIAVFVFIFGLLLLPISVQASEVKTTVEEVSRSVWCPCGCTMLLSDCECETAYKVRTQIEQMISQGKTKEEIIFELQMIYGENILATPQKSGLELMLWVLPIAAAVGGTAIIYRLAYRKPSDVELEEEEYESEELLTAMAKYDEIFEKEYQKFRERVAKK